MSKMKYLFLHWLCFRWINTYALKQKKKKIKGKEIIKRENKKCQVFTSSWISWGFGLVLFFMNVTVFHYLPGTGGGGEGKM